MNCMYRHGGLSPARLSSESTSKVYLGPILALGINRLHLNNGAWNGCSGGSSTENQQTMECFCTSSNLNNFNTCYNCEVQNGDWPSSYPTPSQVQAACQGYGYGTTSINSGTVPTSINSETVPTSINSDAVPSQGSSSSPTGNPLKKSSAATRVSPHISLIIIIGVIILGLFF
ncbi:13925_t:CDS:2 [Acaulospora colombiana]|uniref:13925_t:CDS:1 n=1 Tax=Acaulospora colombiana TaxID=27376 RepID=A0ACA9LYJ9_9GLOM|nr:13925_t:CDS:2 [Acaulospora colombiana]